MAEAHSTEVVGLDKHDPAGMARWLRERSTAAHEFLALDSERQQRQYLNRWQQNVLPHLAFRFEQAAQMIEDLNTRRLQAEHERDALIEQVVAVRADAAETIAHWGAYASAYFQEKHDLAGDIARFKDVPAGTPAAGASSGGETTGVSVDVPAPLPVQAVCSECGVAGRAPEGSVVQLWCNRLECPSTSSDPR